MGGLPPAFPPPPGGGRCRGRPRRPILVSRRSPAPAAFFADCVSWLAIADLVSRGCPHADPEHRRLRTRAGTTTHGKPVARAPARCGGWRSPRRDRLGPPRRPRQPAGHARLLDAAGHCGMLLDPEVIARIVAATTLREDAADLGAPLAA